MSLEPEKKPPKKCPKHNYWLRKGKCSMCRLDEINAQKKAARDSGKEWHPVKIGVL